MNEEANIKTAIEFIKESKSFKSAKYNLLKPLLEKVLDDTITEEDIKKFVDSVAPLGGKNSDTEENLKEGKQVEGYINNLVQNEGDLRKITSIKEIKYIENVGLIDRIEAIKLDSGINIFYGLNASGKSSLYKAICNVLGYEKGTLANINVDANVNISKCCLEVEDWDGKTCEIEWQNGEAKPKLNVGIFDLDISLSLVKNDQDNTFSLAYLKQEYFQLLSEFLEKLEYQLKGRESNLTSKFDLLKQNLQSKLPFLFEEGKELKEENIKDVEISEEEKNNLKELQKEYEDIEKTNFEDKIRILANIITQIEEILKILGEKVETENRFVWEYAFTRDYFEKINNTINEYITYTKTQDNQRTIQLKDYIPENWLKSDTWKRFIESSFDFIRDLSEAKQKEYLEKTCPYCHQILSDRAKKMIESYKILQGETKQKMNDINSKLNGYLDKIKKVLLDLEDFSKREERITEEIKEFSVEKTYDRDVIMAIFTRLKDALLNKNKLEYSQEDIEKVKAFFEYYLDSHNKVLEKKDEYEGKNRNKEQSIKELEIKIQPLKYKNEIVENKENLLRYIRLFNVLKNTEGTLDIIKDAKTYISRLNTDFSKGVFIKEFQKYLDDEYENLNFSKPVKYQLSTKTTHGENKRVYRIGDRKIREIFSEGEQKQHALADFFAQNEIEDFKGVFIFDDPVTSLDECNMEYLAERIIRLVTERNAQVIIFTHNLVFLNYLLELTGEEKVNHFIRASNNAIFLDPSIKLGFDHDLTVKGKMVNERIASIKQKDKNDVSIDEYEIRNIYDLLSGYLESFVEVKIFKSVISRYRPNIRINSLNKVKWNNDLISEVTHLFNKTSRKGSRHSQPIGIQTPTLDGLLKDKEDIDNLVSKIKKL